MDCRQPSAPLPIGKAIVYLSLTFVTSVTTACLEPKTPDVPEAAETSSTGPSTSTRPKPEAIPERIQPGPSPFEVPEAMPGILSWSKSCQDLLALAQDRIWDRLDRNYVYRTRLPDTQQRGAPAPPPFRSFIPSGRGDDPRKRLMANENFIGLTDNNKLWVWDRKQQKLHALDLGPIDPGHKSMAIALQGSTLWLLAQTKSSELAQSERPQNWQAGRHARTLTKVQEWKLDASPAPQRVATTYLPGSSIQFTADAQGAHVALQHPLGQIDERLAQDFVPGLSSRDPNPAIRQAIDANLALLKGLNPESLRPFYVQTRPESLGKQGPLLGCEAIARLSGAHEGVLLKVQIPPAQSADPRAPFGLVDAGTFRHLGPGWVLVQNPKRASNLLPASGFFIQSPTEIQDLQISHQSNATPHLALHGKDVYVVDGYASVSAEKGPVPTKKVTWLRYEQKQLKLQTSIDLPASTQLSQPILSDRGMVSTSSPDEAGPVDRLHKTSDNKLEALAPLYLMNHPNWSYRLLRDDAILGTGVIWTPQGFKQGLSVHRWYQDNKLDPRPSYLLPNLGRRSPEVSLHSAVYAEELSTLLLPYYDYNIADPTTLVFGIWIISVDDQGVISSARNLTLDPIPRPPMPKHQTPQSFDPDPVRAGQALGSQVVFQLHDRLLWIDPVQGTLLRTLSLTE